MWCVTFVRIRGSAVLNGFSLNIETLMGVVIFGVSGDTGNFYWASENGGRMA